MEEIMVNCDVDEGSLKVNEFIGQLRRFAGMGIQQGFGVVLYRENHYTRDTWS